MRRDHVEQVLRDATEDVSLGVLADAITWPPLVQAEAQVRGLDPADVDVIWAIAIDREMWLDAQARDPATGRPCLISRVFWFNF